MTEVSRKVSELLTVDGSAAILVVLSKGGLNDGFYSLVALFLKLSAGLLELGNSILRLDVFKGPSLEDFLLQAVRQLKVTHG